jgi:hypothetical protein
VTVSRPRGSSRCPGATLSAPDQEKTEAAKGAPSADYRTMASVGKALVRHHPRA